jgi:hypothetical protein
MAAYKLNIDGPPQKWGLVQRIAGRLLAQPAIQLPASLGPVVSDSKAIAIFDNFLSDEEFRKIQYWALGLPATINREDRDWSVYIKLDFADCLMSRMWLTDDGDLPPEAQLFVDRIRATDWIEPDASILLGVYRWQQGSGMGEHSDGHTETAVTFYLNDTWQKNWFGDFIFYESKEAELAGFGRAVSPRANRLVINKHTIPHKVTYSSGLAVERLSIQAFVVKPPEKADEKTS